MRVTKITMLAFSFIGALMGAGMASGKEVAIFFENANLFSIILSSFFIALFSYFYFSIGSYSNGNSVSCIFGKYSDIVYQIIRIMNLVFLGSMLGGAESFVLEIFSIHGGAFIFGTIALILYYLKNKILKKVFLTVIPLSLLTLLILFFTNHKNIIGTIKIIFPLSYVTMNVSSAGLFSSTYSKGLNKVEILLSSSLVFILLATIMLVVKSSIIGYENCQLPLYSVSLDTKFKYLCIFMLAGSIITSATSSLTLSINSKNHLSPIISLCIALLISSIGFTNIIRYCYPLLGAFGLCITSFTIAKVISMKLKVKKASVHL